MADKDNVQDGEIVASGQTANGFLDLETLIKSYASRIDVLRKELKEKNQLLQNAFESDSVYEEHAQKAKEANRIKSATKQQILKQPSLSEIAERVRDIKFDISEQNAILTDYLNQYRLQTGVSEIELENGEVMEIVSVVKLVRKSGKK